MLAVAPELEFQPIVMIRIEDIFGGLEVEGVYEAASPVVWTDAPARRALSPVLVNQGVCAGERRRIVIGRAVTVVVIIPACARVEVVGAPRTPRDAPTAPAAADARVGAPAQLDLGVAAILAQIKPDGHITA